MRRSLLGLSALGLTLFFIQGAAGQALSSRFTYQGYLESDGLPVNGLIDLQCAPYNAEAGGGAVGPAVQRSNVSVQNGLFTVELDFGIFPFTGEARWLEIAVRHPAGSGDFVTLAPRQAVTATPYALHTRGLFVDAGGRAAFGASAARTALDIIGAEQPFLGQLAIVNEFQDSSSNNCDVYITGYGNEFIGGNDATGRLWYLGNAASSNQDFFLVNQLDGALRFGTDGRPSDLYLAANAQLGVGTTTPDARLEVQAGSPAEAALLTAGSNADLATPAGENLSIGHWDRATDTFTPRIHAATSGQVGIGTTTPDARLEVRSASFGEAALLTTGSNADLVTLTNEDLTFGHWDRSTNAFTPRIHVEFNGRVGINTTDPQATFQVAGTTVLGSGEPAAGYPITLKDDVIIERDVFAFLDLDVFTLPTLRDVLRMNWDGSWWTLRELNNAFSRQIITATAFHGDNGLAEFRLMDYNDDWQVRMFISNELPGVVGTIEADVATIPGKFFKIDHPLDPANKYLYHACVESPDMKNVYDGVVTTDADGYATITLPEYVEALNRDFRYQLTVIDTADHDDFVLAKVVEEVAKHQFTVRTSAPFTKLSWQLTGIRQDPFATALGERVEVEKTGPERGRYMHPSLYGQPEELSISRMNPSTTGESPAETD